MAADKKNSTDYADFSGGIGYHLGACSWRRRLLRPWGMLLTCSGQGLVRFDGREIAVSPRQLLIYRPEYAYEFSCSDSWKYIWFHYPLRDHLIEAMTFDEALPGLGCFTFDPRGCRKVRFLLLEACDLDERRPPGWYQLALISVENALLRAVSLENPPKLRDHDRIAKATKLLTSSQCGDMDEIAARCGVSTPLLYLLFRREMGCSPRKYRELHLLRRGQHLLLHSQLSLAEISRKLGMCDQYYFSNRFKKVFGCSPSEYRKNGG